MEKKLKFETMEKKEELISIVSDHLRSSIRIGDVDAIMPILYILCAFKEGHYLSILSRNGNSIFASSNRRIQLMDGPESDLLKLIRTSVSEDYFIGTHAADADKLYQKLLDLLDFDSIKVYYPVLVDFIIQYILNDDRDRCVVQVPNDISLLVGKLINMYECKSAYYPFSGICSFIRPDEVKDVEFHAQEIHGLSTVLAKVIADAHGRNLHIKNEDCVSNWEPGNPCDCIVSFPPVRVRLETKDISNWFPPTCMSEEFPFCATYAETKARYGIYVLPADLLFNPRYSGLRWDVLKPGRVKMVIELPTRIARWSIIQFCIVVMDMHNEEPEAIRLVDASDCIDKVYKGLRILDVQAIMDRVTAKSDSGWIDYSTPKIYHNDGILLPSHYISEQESVDDGTPRFYIRDVAETIHLGHSTPDKDAPFITSDKFHTDIVDSFLDESPLIQPKSFEGAFSSLSCQCVITTPRYTSFYIKKDDMPVFVNRIYHAYKVNKEVITPEYFVYALQQEISKMDDSIVTVNRVESTVKIPVPSLDEQKEIINALINSRREQYEKKSSKLAKLADVSEHSANLLHDLGILFMKMGSSVDLLSDVAPELSLSLRHCLDYAIRQVDSSATDFNEVTATINKENLFDVIHEYVDSWTDSGFATFDVEFMGNENGEVIVEIDKKLLFTALDCIFINAHQHGFQKVAKECNTVRIYFSRLTLPDDETRYMNITIANNGEPISVNVSQYAERCFSTNPTEHEGLGGDHVAKIIHKFGGKISLSHDNEWSEVNLILPIYLDSNINYECEEYEEEYL